MTYNLSWASWIPKTSVKKITAVLWWGRPSQPVGVVMYMSTGTVSRPLSLSRGRLTAVMVLNMANGLASVSDNGGVPYRAFCGLDGSHGSEAEEYRLKQLHFGERLYKTEN